MRYYERVKIIKEVHKLLEAHPTFPKGSVVKAVKEDRDSHQCIRPIKLKDIIG